MISEWFVESMNHTCGPYDPEVDEVALAGFQTVPSKVVRVTIRLGYRFCLYNKFILCVNGMQNYLSFKSA